MGKRMMIPAKSPGVEERAIRHTPNKVETLDLLAKRMQYAAGKERPYGDWIHTPGPGKVRECYFILEQAIHPNSKYIAVEVSPDRHIRMRGEAAHFRERRRREEPWLELPDITVSNSELFEYATRKILSREREVLIVNADLCANPATMVRDGLLNGLKSVCNANKSVGKKDFFLSLTYSTRTGSKDKQANYRAINLINDVIRKHGGDFTWQRPYQDGCRMETMLWYFG